MFILLSLSLGLSEELPPQRNDFSFVEAVSVYEQIQGIKKLSPPFSSADRKRLWQLYFQTRLGVQAEDPDIFERSLDLLIQDYRNNPSMNLSEDITLPLYQTSLLHLQTQWSNRYPQLQNLDFSSSAPSSKLEDELQEIIKIQWSEHGLSWLESFQTENGSRSIELFRWILFQQLPNWEKQISPQFAAEIQNTWNLNPDSFQLAPPEQQPGQTKHPIPKHPEITLQQFPSKPQIPWRWIILLALLGFIIPLRKWKLGKLIFGFFSLLLLENTSSLFIQPLIETDSFFNFHHWQIEPWQERNDYLETQGSYIRAQRFQREKQGRRIVILGASSAHGSNHLWEDSIAGILEKETETEVINLGIGGTTSHGILHLLPYTLELQPDFIILYYGHNEVHQFEQLMEFQQSSVQTLWLKNILWRSSIYSFLYQNLRSSSNSEEIKASEVSAIKPKNQHNDIVELAKWNHMQNISILLEAYQEAQIPVILLNPPTNYPFAPVDEQFQANPVQTIPEKQAQINQSTEATTIHSEIRANNLELAKQFGLYYLDLDQYFHMNSPDQFSANGLFWDELHPSALGQEWITKPLIPLLKK